MFHTPNSSSALSEPWKVKLFSVTVQNKKKNYDFYFFNNTNIKTPFRAKTTLRKQIQQNQESKEYNPVVYKIEFTDHKKVDTYKLVWINISDTRNIKQIFKTAGKIQRMHSLYWIMNVHMTIIYRVPFQLVHWARDMWTGLCEASLSSVVKCDVTSYLLCLTQNSSLCSNISQTTKRSPAILMQSVENDAKSFIKNILQQCHVKENYAK